MNQLNSVVAAQTRSERRPKFDHVRAFLVFVNALVLVAVVVVVYWLFFDDNPASEVFDATPRTTHVNAGDSVVVDLTLCKYTTAPAEVHLTWVNSLLFIEPPQYPVFNNTGCQPVAVVVNVPDILPDAAYMVQGYVHYQVNPLSERQTDFEFGPIVVGNPVEPSPVGE